MRVYTRTGDKGTTSLASGTRVPKYHERLEAYGTVDELNSIIGWVEAQVSDPEIILLINKIQSRIFTISSCLAMDKEEFKAKLPTIKSSDVEELEKDMDRMLDLLPPLRSFILPGGHPAVAACHMARTVCRRTERLMVKLAETIEIDELQLKYINRLSDYFFVAARKTALDFGVPEKNWDPDYEDKE
ncbi:MAG: cob(I)yrinic acid a,c-diamide adenosyltransferase [Bacteroidales bacterium]|nr:cob(I)yrinic acid a,c-diamide adenosyltransferase [Bacteroidales bacterium]